MCVKDISPYGTDAVDLDVASPRHLTFRQLIFFENAVKTGNHFELDQMFSQYEALFQTSQSAHIPAMQILSSMLSLMLSKNRENCGCFQECLTLLTEIPEGMSSAQLFQQLLRLAHGGSITLCHNINIAQKPPDLIDSIVLYVSKNFSDESLTLGSTADGLGFSAGYMGDYFKRTTGVNFTDYLISVRMENAKILLSSNQYKTYEIALCCGFSNSHYFSVVFKKYAGVTPTAYRDKHSE